MTQWTKCTLQWVSWINKRCLTLIRMRESFTRSLICWLRKEMFATFSPTLILARWWEVSSYRLHKHRRKLVVSQKRMSLWQSRNWFSLKMKLSTRIKPRVNRSRYHMNLFTRKMWWRLKSIWRNERDRRLHLCERTRRGKSLRFTIRREIEHGAKKTLTFEDESNTRMIL